MGMQRRLQLWQCKVESLHGHLQAGGRRREGAVCEGCREGFSSGSAKSKVCMATCRNRELPTQAVLVLLHNTGFNLQTRGQKIHKAVRRAPGSCW